MDFGGLRFLARSAGKALAPRTALPEMLVVFVTNACEMSCTHCFYWQELNRPGSSLTAEEWGLVARHLGRPGAVILTGGEPFARSDFLEVAQAIAIHAQPRVLGIVTNGSRTSRILKDVEMLLANLPRGVRLTVAVSLDGPPEVHDRLRGYVGAHKSAVATLEGLHELRQRFANFATHVCTIFSADTQAFAGEFALDVLNRLSPDSVGLSLVRGKPPDEATKAVDLEAYRKAVARVHRHSLIARRSPGGRVGAQVGAALNQWKSEVMIRSALGEYSVPCVAGRLAGTISPDGDVAPCELREEKFGNLRDVGYRFDKLWRSAAKTEFCRTILETRCRCTHELWVAPSLAFRPASWPELAIRAARVTGGE